MDGETYYSIGDLARRTGLSIKTIRFYSDNGIVPPTERNSRGYRRYSVDAVARLDLVRTLRDLGLDLPTVKKVVDREIALPDVARAHADALAVQIKALRLRRAVFTAVARRGSTPEELDVMQKLIKLSETERQRMINEFIDAAFGDMEAHPELEGIARTMTPAELPDNPDADQVEAWVELAELAQDPEFRAGVRRMAEHHAADRAGGAPGVHRDPVATVRDLAGPAVQAGVDPASPHADSVIRAVTQHYSFACGHPDDADLRRRLLTRLETANDPRRERYLQHLSVINGWAPPDDLAPSLNWFIQALRVREPAA
ncbi:MerR family transcriptional regulator [Winogradskya humida]|uniref:MerR family transcriptional regulator n=1 Tax=Winogradskya humida TaxID=113566 RepID=A0ABQ3ZUE0_9ACTN|nr:MerR family transcriptional regulator [Actinoplanes humidus]GIE22217.1 MerR family transcriptional regulator [Actinoplanes humidus]